jgi:RNA polymerase sigma factor (sigma-70 family)
LLRRAADPQLAIAEREQAFSELVRIFQDRAYSCAYAVLGDFHLAQDAVQEAFVSAWRKLHQLRHPEAFPAWFRRLILTECHRLTRRKRLRTISFEDALNAAASDSRDSELQNLVEAAEQSASVLDAIHRLPETQRIVVMLFYVEEHSQRDISTFLGVPQTTVAKRLYSARERLRDMVFDDLKKDFTAHRPSRNTVFARKVRAGIYDEYVGQYRFELRPELIVTIRRQGDKLIGEGGGQTNELYAKGRTTSELRTREFDGRGRFVRNAAGAISHLIYYEFGVEMGRAIKIA